MFNQVETYKAWLEAAVRHNWDTALPPILFQPVKIWEKLQITQMKWPGGQLQDHLPFQWVDAEYVSQAEYSEMLSSPNSFAVKKFWPRISKSLAPISDMMQMEPPPPLLYFSSAYSLPSLLGEMASLPQIKQLLTTLLDVADEYVMFKECMTNYVTKAKSQGFPLVFGPQTIASIDWVADVFRGLRGSMLDMYRVPDQLKALVDEFTPYTITAPMLYDVPFECRRVFIPMHWGAAGFMSDNQFEEFYWPSIKALILGLVDAGYTPVPLFEGDYTPRLKYLAELPPGKVAGHFDYIDRKKAKEIIGDTMCFWGNVSSSLLCTGTPRQVEDDVKELIDIFGDNGGLIIDCNMGIPDEAKPENVQAMTDAVMKYGIY